ncbi:CxxxxCH/CxxCH domain-containing protein [Corynebacterium sp. HMSC074A01]|uniref:CxxxxCH/CxxCH domain-containing protein n=1 Tax=Corynebacterium sp. HMSC074A01 TaxID=1715030 RepID=UPI00114D24A6
MSKGGEGGSVKNSTYDHLPTWGNGKTAPLRCVNCHAPVIPPAPPTQSLLAPVYWLPHPARA